MPRRHSFSRSSSIPYSHSTSRNVSFQITAISSYLACMSGVSAHDLPAMPFKMIRFVLQNDPVCAFHNFQKKKIGPSTNSINSPWKVSTAHRTPLITTNLRAAGLRHLSALPQNLRRSTAPIFVVTHILSSHFCNTSHLLRFL